MKECEEFAPLLSAFVDGELTEEERAEVLAHVSECEKCRRLLGELTALHAALGELEDEDVPAGFTEGVMAAVRAEKAAAKPQVKKRSTWRRWLPMAACAALVALKFEGSDVTVYSDSKYVVDAVTKGWVFGWEKKRFAGKKNPDLWMRFLRIYRRHNVRFVWVKGHADTVENNRCDQLAVAAANDKAHLSEDTGYEPEER